LKSNCLLLVTISKNHFQQKVANYGIAGQYYAHYDAVMMHKEGAGEIQRRALFNQYAGDRMATVSFRLNS